MCATPTSQTPGRGLRLLFAIVRWSGLAFLIREVVQGRRATILLLHDEDPETLDRQLSVLGKRFSFISLREYVQAARSGSLKSLPRKPLIYTLDDGHASNRELTDVFRKHGVTPTLFVCSGIVGTDRRFWWSVVPPAEDIEVLKSLPDHARADRLRELGHHDTTEYDERCALSADEIEQMRGVVDFQSHTLFHPILTRCSDQRAWSEIEGSKQVLEDAFGLDVYAFAYPNGSYADRELAYVARAGYECAITTRAGFNSARTPLLELRRIGMTDGLTTNEIVARASGLPAWWGQVTGRRRLAEPPEGAVTPADAKDDAAGEGVAPPTRRLKIVIVARHFRPESDAGAVRPWRQAELLSRRGHDVTVITAAKNPTPGAYAVYTIPHRSPGQWARMLTGGSSSRALSEDFQGRLGMDASVAEGAVGAAKQALIWLQGGTIWGLRSGMRVRSLARRGRIDLLVTSSPPYAVHWAGLLARSRARKWVLDYRDLYTSEPYYESKGLKAAFERRFEKACLRRCDVVTITAPGVGASVERVRQGVRIVSAPTGIWGEDPGPSHDLPAPEASDRPLTVLYTGILYNGQRDPEPMIEALALLRSSSDHGNRFRVVFMGADCDAARYVAERHGVTDAVELAGALPSEEARQSQREADALLILGMEKFDSTSQAIPQKLWEYMETGRLIIATGFPADGYVAQLLHDYRLSIVSDDPKVIADRLLAFAEGRFDATAEAAEPARESATGVPTSADMVDVFESLAAAT